MQFSPNKRKPYVLCLKAIAASSHIFNYLCKSSYWSRMMQDSSSQDLEPPECCIYQIPHNIKRRREFYTPLLFSIGPLHYGKVELAAVEMEKQKLRCYDKFCSRLYGTWQEEFKSFIQHHETRIRNTYRYISGTCTLSSDVFRKMILYDSVFILELLISYHEGGNDGILNQSFLKDSIIRRDLLLLENQVPYFILDKLHKLMIADIGIYYDYPSLLILSCNFLRICMPKEVLSMPKKEYDKIKVAHFTDLARYALVGILPRDLGRSSGNFMAVPTASTLKKSGVRLESGGSILDIKCLRTKFLVWRCELQLPHLKVNMFSESIFGNIRALEQCGYDLMSSHFTNFLFLMRCLVNNEEDLDLLVTEKIISNKFGNAVEVVKLLKRVSEEITLPERDVWGICDHLRAQVTFCDVEDLEK
ncbi:hypothetical protein ACOSP7_003628 [Xanthoceras sorbifolium]